MLPPASCPVLQCPRSQQPTLSGTKSMSLLNQTEKGGIFNYDDMTRVRLLPTQTLSLARAQRDRGMGTGMGRSTGRDFDQTPRSTAHTHTHTHTHARAHGRTHTHTRQSAHSGLKRKQNTRAGPAVTMTRFRTARPLPCRITRPRISKTITRNITPRAHQTYLLHHG